MKLRTFVVLRVLLYIICIVCLLVIAGCGKEKVQQETRVSNFKPIEVKPIQVENILVETILTEEILHEEILTETIIH